LFGLDGLRLSYTTGIIWIGILPVGKLNLTTDSVYFDGESLNNGWSLVSSKTAGNNAPDGFVYILFVILTS
jgi:hypothetical protein